MFTPLGLFKEVPCPQGADCSLVTCIFQHDVAILPTATPTEVQEVSELKVSISANSETSSVKRRKFDTSHESGTLNTSPAGFKSEEKSRISSNVTSRKPEADRFDEELTTGSNQLQSTRRKVSPPPKRHTAPVELPKNEKHADPENRLQAPHALPPRQAPKEVLDPRTLAKPPATYQTRHLLVTKLHTTMVKLNDQLAKDKLNTNTNESLVLTKQELITLALDEEEKIAKESPQVYANVVKLRIVKLQKMGLADWTKEVLAHLHARYYKNWQPRLETKPPGGFQTSLTQAQELAIVPKLQTNIRGREQFGYITKVPSTNDVELARKGVEAGHGWEKCDRCGGRFQVFPGRREDGSLTSGGQCTYHPGKVARPQKKATDHITGHKDAYYPCCGEVLGASAGCTKAEHHVFKISDANRLAAVLQFEETPIQPGKGPFTPLCFDCEMAYTTLGMELIRLTALRWPDGRTLLDVLVKPMGEVLDLNSRYSGIWPEHYANAIPYDPSISPGDKDILEDTYGRTEPMQVVDSPAAARALLLKLLQPDTLLMGHAIDNDLNACRIIHPTIIDTVLLYPHPAGLPIRYSLKNLTKKYLDRDIQTGGDKGHDSSEDARATGDLVRAKVAEKWKLLSRQGWALHDDRLVPPAAGSPISLKAISETRKKRKNESENERPEATKLFHAAGGL